MAQDGSASLSVSMSLQPGMAALIQRLNAAGDRTNTPTLNGPSIAASMTGAPGIRSVTFRNTSQTAIEGQANISQIGDFLSASRRGFITFNRGQQGGSCVININRENSVLIIEALSDEIADYLNALMAPIATGEEMTKQEYLELVSSFYNRTISNEISASRILLSIDFPGNITRAAAGTFSGRRAVFNIPLLDLLVLETPLVYEVIWN